MIAQIAGTVLDKSMSSVVIDVHGLAFEVFISAHTASRLPQAGEQAVLHTILSVREDDMSLFGFESRDEKQLFMKLRSVSGIGPKIALAALSSMSAQDLLSAILHEDVTRVSSVPGIGKKTAQRIILELKGALSQEASLFSVHTEAQTGQGTPLLTDDKAAATEALVSMGFSPQEIELALRGYEGTEDVESYIKFALRRLGS